MGERWLEPVLEQELRPVTAPGELWNRVLFPRVERPRRLAGRLLWALAATVLVLAVLGVRASRPSTEFRSADAAAIQTWVKAHSGLDLELAAKPAGAIQLLGARLIPGKTPSVEVAFRAGNRGGRLLVTRANAAADQPASHGGSAATSWVMHGQRYTLACASPQELQAACVLCHS